MNFSFRKVMCSLLALSFVSVGLTPAAIAADAKNLFLRQAAKPNKPINTGLSYWIELERNKKKTRVTNKTTFKNGDQIRFHIKPNVNGYAYILMLQGSKGDKAVLFPSDKVKENKVAANKEIVLPTGSGNSLEFDKNPGLEILRLVVSRKPIDPKNFLKPESRNVMIASNSGGKKSQVPEEVLVSMVVPEKGVKEAQTKNVRLRVASDNKPENSGEVTVVSTNTQKPLSVDVALNHE